MPQSPAQLEHERLCSLIATVWEGGRHYSPSCRCDGCELTRSELSERDLSFIDLICHTVTLEEDPIFD